MHGRWGIFLGTGSEDITVTTSNYVPFTSVDRCSQHGLTLWSFVDPRAFQTTNTQPPLIIYATGMIAIRQPRLITRKVYFTDLIMRLGSAQRQPKPHSLAPAILNVDANIDPIRRI